MTSLLAYGPAWTAAAAIGMACLFTRYAKREQLLGVGGTGASPSAPRGMATSDSGQGLGTEAPTGCGHERPTTMGQGPGRPFGCHGGRV